MKKRKGSVGFVLQKKDAAVKEETHFIKRILNTLLIVFAAVVLGFGVTQFVMQSVYMTGPSMQETLKDGDEMLLNKFAYKLGRIKRFDIVAIKKIGSNDYYDIKRVVGIPGDTISVVAGRLVINGKQISSNYSFSVINSPGVLSESMKLGEDEYFCIGDNTSNSEDSRFINYGNVQKSEIKGKISYIVFPKERRGKVTYGY
ncbi:MAG: signal peptidase I [Eubacterium sp.]|nr:signal peptidase I [Eubacterium sp.]